MDWSARPDLPISAPLPRPPSTRGPPGDPSKTSTLAPHSPWQQGGLRSQRWGRLRYGQLQQPPPAHLPGALSVWPCPLGRAP